MNDRNDRDYQQRLHLVAGNVSAAAAAEKSRDWRSWVSLAKDLLPWLTMLATAIYSFGVKASTSDRVQQLQQDDHIAITSMREKMSDLGGKESAIEAKVDVIMQTIFRQGQQRHEDK